MPALVGPVVKEVTCCRYEVRALAILARAKTLFKLERKRILVA